MSRGHHTSYTGGNTVDDNIITPHIPEETRLMTTSKHGNYRTKLSPLANRRVGQERMRDGHPPRKWKPIDLYRTTIEGKREGTLEGGLIDLYQNEWQI